RRRRGGRRNRRRLHPGHDGIGRAFRPACLWRHHLSRHLRGADGLPQPASARPDGQAMGMKPTPTTAGLAAAAAALAILLIVVPWVIAATGRSALFFTLTAVALLSIASAGVWLTFFIGRINIGQGAYALIGGYVAAILVVDYAISFWLAL